MKRNLTLLLLLLFYACIIQAQDAPTVTGDSDLCAGDNSVLTASGEVGATFAWHDAPTDGNLLSSMATIAVSPSSNMYLYVDQTVAGMTSPRTEVFVRVSAIPSPLFPISVLATPAFICEGESSDLTANVDSTNHQKVHWYDAATDGNLIAVIDSGEIFTVSPTMTTIYYAQSEVENVNEVFNYTGSIQTFTVPTGIYSIDVTANGAKGGKSFASGGPGLGGRVEATLEVTPGQVLNIYVGESGRNYSNSGSVKQPGGWNGGGNCVHYYTGSGGGATDIRINGTSYADRVLVAGGAGGKGYNCTSGDWNPHGGGLTGATAAYCTSGNAEGTRGHGGSQIAGGRKGCSYSAVSCGQTGSFGVGGNGGSYYGTSPGAPGGGGWYGGGGGSSKADGGGGSSYTDPILCTAVTHTQGINNGHGNLTISYSLASNCANTNRIPVTVDVQANPILTVSNDTYNCPGVGTTLTVSGADSYDWIPGNLSGASISVDPTTTTNYSVTGTIGVCTTMEDVLVSVSDVLAPNDVAICENSSITLTASGAVSYTWEPGTLNGPSITVSPTETTTYIVTGTDPSGCVTTDDVVVTVNVNPVITASMDTLIVLGGSAVISASGADSYTWSPGSLSGESVSVSPIANTTYTVTGTYTTTGCKNTDVVNVNVVELPTLSGVSTLLVNETTTLTATGPSGSTFEWFDAEVAGNLLASTAAYTTNPLSGNTDFFVQLNDGVNDSPRMKISVTVIDPTLTNAVAAESSICPGASTTLSADMISPGSVDWYDAETGGNLIGTSSIGNDLTVSPSAMATYYAQGMTETTDVTFNYTGAAQTFTVPVGVTSIAVDAYGAAGGKSFNSTPGALGGRVQATMNVEPGQVLNIYIGGAGRNYSNTGSTAQPGGWNGGGNSVHYYTGSGGGATDIRIAGNTYADRILVAGAAGGRGYNCNIGQNPNGGGLIGGSGNYCSSGPGEGTRGRGGSQTAGGRRGCWWSGSGCGGTGTFGRGGNGGNSSGSPGAPGGGGWYGGGGGTNKADGGGGSSYTQRDLFHSVVHTAGVRSGNGTMTISYSKNSATTAMLSTTVNVEDVAPPVPDVLNLPNEEGDAPVIVLAPSATDACEGAIVATTSDPLTYNLSGTYQVTWDYVDGTGNMSSQNQTVIVGLSLPVELSRFTLDCDGSRVALEWETASESNSSHFNIQRSKDGMTWRTIGRKEAQGNSDFIHQYNFSIPSLADYSLYRLEQVDFDGTKDYSSLLHANCQYNEMGVRVYPNPTSEIVRIEFAEQIIHPLELVLFDEMGKELVRKSINQNSRPDEMSFSLKELPSGFYQIQLLGLHKPQSYRIIKIDK